MTTDPQTPAKPKTVEERITDCRAYLAGDGGDSGDGVPKWVPTQWVNAIIYRVGQAAYNAQRFEEAIFQTLPGSAADSLGSMCHDLICIAAVCMDAVEALERLESDATDAGVKAAVAEAVDHLTDEEKRMGADGK